MDLKNREKNVLRGVDSPLYFKGVLGIYLILLVIFMVISFILIIVLGKIFGLVGGVIGVCTMLTGYFICAVLSKQFGKNGHHLLFISFKRPKGLKLTKPTIKTGKIL